MRHLFHALLVIATSAAFAADDEKPKPDDKKEPNPVAALISKEDTYENNLVGKLLIPFDAKLLTALAKDPDEKPGKLGELILQAGVEKNKEFRYLLGDDRLRKNMDVRRALLAYDYNVNGNKKSLEELLEIFLKEAKAAKSWDLAALSALGSIDEWDLTKTALTTYRLSADGTGGAGRYSFWLRRRYYYPDNKAFPADYQEFAKEIKRLQIKTANAPPDSSSDSSRGLPKK